MIKVTLLNSYQKFLKCFLCFWIVAFSINYCYATGAQSLEKFLNNNTITADFTQTVYGKKKNRVISGAMEISRPNKFLWNYDDDGQLIISNGVNIYIYDKLLKQVTVKGLSKSLGKSPALLLAGGNDVKKYYTIVAKPDANGMEWVSLTPIANKIVDNNGFKVVDIGFNKSNQMLAKMNFVDGFDNKSTIDFKNVKVGVKLNPLKFEFKAPSGTDVINGDE